MTSVDARIGLHDIDGGRYPNLALMKLAAHHNARGDSVRWYAPIESFDTVYGSKVFTFTDADPYLPADAILGGTGYCSPATLPDDIEHTLPDYSLYGIDYGMGFLTRGCPRRCPWCVVPEKEGGIQAHAEHGEFANPASRDLVLLDNNVLASEHGIREIERIAAAGYRVDFNQGLDARLIARDDGIAKLLGRCRWLKPIRLACDTSGQMATVGRAVEALRRHGASPKTFFCYVLVKDIPDALDRVEFLRSLNVDPFAQPFLDFTTNAAPTLEQRRFARWVNHKAIFKSMSWADYGKKPTADEGQTELFA